MVEPKGRAQGLEVPPYLLPKVLSGAEGNEGVSRVTGPDEPWSCQKPVAMAYGPHWQRPRRTEPLV